MTRVHLAACAALLLPVGQVALARGSNPAAPQKTSQGSPANNNAEAELQKALASAGNDSAALVRNLKDYLQEFPDAPRKAAVYRALVEGCEQLRDNACALDYAERLIAVHPDDSQMMLLAVNLLERQGDDASLTRAAGYVTRVLDRVEKTPPEERPARESLAEWRNGRNQFRAALYYERGRVENSQHNYEAATKDFQVSDSIHANALAAEKLGEMAEMRKDSATAIKEYARAFVLPESGPAGTVNRRDVRRKLGNVWRQVHGNEQGLGEAILAAYDRASSPPMDAAAGRAVQNKDAKEPLAFVLRRLNGSQLPLAPLKGKVVVLSFWATWCGPCRELEPIFNQVAESYAGNPNVTFFAVNTDDDQTRVVPFVAGEKWNVPVVYADGLDVFLKVDSLPTVLVLGRTQKIVYRAEGLAPEGFPASLIAAIQGALGTAQ
ncbi:MAG TPA: redoxin family protein [Candidatus Polarisedimenticolia bacterium]|nr:redoxin family protein [Candidatus Polarisedimenticolia bacterium]